MQPSCIFYLTTSSTLSTLKQSCCSRETPKTSTTASCWQKKTDKHCIMSRKHYCSTIFTLWYISALHTMKPRYCSQDKPLIIIQILMTGRFTDQIGSALPWWQPCWDRWTLYSRTPSHLLTCSNWKYCPSAQSSGPAIHECSLSTGDKQRVNYLNHASQHVAHSYHFKY